MSGTQNDTTTSGGSGGVAGASFGGGPAATDAALATNSQGVPVVIPRVEVVDEQGNPVLPAQMLADKLDRLFAVLVAIDAKLAGMSPGSLPFSGSGPVGGP